MTGITNTTQRLKRNIFHSEIVIYKSNLILLHSERPKLHTILAFLSAIGLKQIYDSCKTLVISEKMALINTQFSLNSNVYVMLCK